MSVDFPRAWQIAREAPFRFHNPECSYYIHGGGLLCDCYILTDHPEYKDNILQGIDGEPCRDQYDLYNKLKNFYAQPLDGCWPLKPCWVPDLQNPPKHIFSRNVLPGQPKTRVTNFRRFTYEEFAQILGVKNGNA
uniref:Uncharacterized protein n=1 Tax=viral metagenome TaxID=1070528 RepID=A0A6M3K8D4_9ZZZZ